MKLINEIKFHSNSVFFSQVNPSVIIGLRTENYTGVDGGIFFHYFVHSIGNSLHQGGG